MLTLKLIYLSLLTLLFTAPAYSQTSILPLIDKHFLPLASGSIQPQRRYQNMVVGVFTPREEMITVVGQTNSAINENSVFEIGSITKGVVGILLAQAELEGRIRLDSSFTETARIPLLSFQGKPATWKHLAQHTSGLPALPLNFHFKDKAQPYADYTRENLNEFLLTYQPLREPAAKHEYSNLGAGLVGIGLEAVYSAPLETLLIEKVLSPLKLENTRINLSDEQKAKLIAGTRNGVETPIWSMENSPLAAAGALRSTPKDLLTLLKALMGQADPKLLPALARATDGTYKTETGERIGLFWNVTPEGYVWHNGSTWGTRSFLAFDPATQVGIVVLSNSATFNEQDVPFYDFERAGFSALVDIAKAVSLPRPVEAIRKYDSEIKKRLESFGTVPAAPENKEWVKKKLAHMYEIDQYMREFSSTPAKQNYSKEETDYFWSMFAKRFALLDFENTSTLKSLMKVHGWIKHSTFGDQATNQAWLLAQHADNDPQFQKEVLKHLEELWPVNEVQAAHYAYMFDRVAASWSDERKRTLQRFGTQGMCKGSVWEPLPIEEPSMVDVRRRLMELEPLSRYIEKVSQLCSQPAAS